MIVKILLGLPINKTFTYTISRELERINYKVGNLVEVNFRGSKKIGIILEKNKTSKIKKVKDVNKIFVSVLIKDSILSAIKLYSEYTCNRKSDLIKILLSNFNSKKLVYEDGYEQINLPDKFNLVEKKINILSCEQEYAIKKISKTGLNKFNVFVLDGVTGSGKTRVYLNILLKVLKKKCQCLILVPEIFLTKQWIQSFVKEFGFSPNIYHSSITKSEREKIWIGVVTGKINLVIGTRSALFLPFSNLSFMVIDEEHDISYKQETGTIFNSRDYGIVLAKYFNCPVVLASATPSIETIYNCRINKYIRVSLNKRIKNLPLPKLQIIDMRSQKKRPDRWISEKLEFEIRETLREKKQTLMFLNKRGYAPVIFCKICGQSKICPYCDYSLVLHKKYDNKTKDFLACHWCDYKEEFKNNCCDCNKESLVAAGPGIQKLFEETKDLFPKAKILMISSDTLDKKNDVDRVIDSIVSKKIDIIVGTQIISKGHNFPDISTVGIVNIDNQLKSFDIRSNEKIFQMLTQVSGRAGREYLSRGVYIQTFFPNDKLIQNCVKSSKENFYDEELTKREENMEPPFFNLISIVNQNKDLNLLRSQNKLIKDELRKFKELSVYGPAPSPIFKIRGKFRYRFLLKFRRSFKNKKELKRNLLLLKENKKLNLKVDVDPLNFV